MTIVKRHLLKQLPAILGLTLLCGATGSYAQQVSQTIDYVPTT